MDGINGIVWEWGMSVGAVYTRVPGRKGRYSNVHAHRLVEES